MSENTSKFEKVIEHLRHELAGLRIGRASVALLDSVMVDSYGSKVPISHVATVNVADVRSLTIQPWDKGNMPAIEKAIQASNWGINPVNEGNQIRINIPSMTEERRKEMVKVLGQLAEQAKISVRNIREEVIKDFKKQEDNGQLTKDDLDAAKKDLQTEVDKFNDQIKEIAATKEKEILTI